MTAKRLPRPRDPAQLAKLLGDILTGQVEDRASPPPVDTTKDPAAVSLGRRGGLKGGKARAAKMTPEQRAEIARKAAKARWGDDVRRWQDELKECEATKAKMDVRIGELCTKLQAAALLAGALFPTPATKNETPPEETSEGVPKATAEG